MFVHQNVFTPIEVETTESKKGRFYHIPNGNTYPSITTILGTGDKPWLTDWRQSLGDVKADKEMKRAADRGTAVHSMIEKFLNNNPTPTERHLLEHIGEFNSLKLHLKKINNIITQETPLWSDVLKTAGRVDCVGEFDGVLSLIDFKTSTNSKNDTMIFDYWLQVTAYALMFQERYNIQIDNAVIIMSVERGFPLVFRQPIEQYIEPLINRINTYYVNQGDK